ncbi:hypothetical protein N665_0218s0047 [Sinapis alba]|nr:hypothetical protein N665_0218s0047 [Sinapis alba]
MQVNAKTQEIHLEDQDAAAPPRQQDDTDTEDEGPQVARRINLISAQPLTSYSSEDTSDRDLRRHLQQKRSTTDMRDALLQRKRTKLSDEDLRQKLISRTNTPTSSGESTSFLEGLPYAKLSKGIRKVPAQSHHPHNDPLLVELQIGTCEVTHVFIDTGSSVDLIFRQTLVKMMVDLKDIKPSSRALTGFNGLSTTLLGTIRLNVFIAGISKFVKFSVIDTETQYNAILGTSWLHLMKAVPSTYHQCVKFPIREGKIFTLNGNQRLARSMLVGIDAENPDSHDLTTELTTFLRANKSTFAWTTTDMPVIDPTVTAHRLNVDPTYKPIKQKPAKTRPRESQGCQRRGRQTSRSRIYRRG